MRMTTLEAQAMPIFLRPVDIRDLIILDNCPCPLYFVGDGEIHQMIGKGDFFSREMLADIALNELMGPFVMEEDLSEFIEVIQQKLRDATRSLSMGNIEQNSIKQINLLTAHMGELYRLPSSDHVLLLQFQSVQTLARFLAGHTDLLPKLFKNFKDMRHHYLRAQPLLSSFLTLGLAKYSHLFSEKELESLFLTSYFKDLGMALLPRGISDQEVFEGHQLDLVKNHTQISYNLLKGRISLNSNYLTIIKNHHLHSQIAHHEVPKEDIVLGVETLFVSVADIVAAMISKRPYRNETDLFDSLELIKKEFANDYPNEFKVIVSFFKNFFY